MKQVLMSTVILAVFLAPAPAETWKVDKAHSQVTFSVSHLVIAEVRGRFKEFDVTMYHENDDFTDARIEAVIRAASLDTDNERRDNHLRSDDFFNVEKFPELKFTSSSMEKTGKNTYKLKGDLTIRDITKPIVLDVRFNGAIKDPGGNTKIGFKATTTISRFEFGTKWSRVLETGELIAGEMVDITLLMEFEKES
ncbi:MAG: polyisoprenoid-binding protein [Ignavibacteriae bacterium]|nr:polyisoprenoid-binding protein [Ignavibacteriota bacterium]